MSLKIEENGYLTVDLPDGSIVRLDIYVSYARFSQAIIDGGSDVREQQRHLAEAMKEFGVPPDLSYMSQFRIFLEVKKLAEDAQKKDGLTPPVDEGRGSPGTTDSTHTS